MRYRRQTKRGQPSLLDFIKIIRRTAGYVSKKAMSHWYVIVPVGAEPASNISHASSQRQRTKADKLSLGTA